MSDIALSVLVSRTRLGLGPLQIASGGTYFLTPQFLGATVTWTRQQVGSPFADGQVTTSRVRQNVTETVGVEVRADTYAELDAAISAVIAAFTQDRFTMTIEVGDVDIATYQYRCEAADYQTLTWNTARLYSMAGQVLFQMPRQPVAVVGV